MPTDILQITAKLDRSDTTTPWGFRMQGGKDFSRPVTIQRVTPGSLADKCGLRPGDAIVKIGDYDASDIQHKDAQQAVLHAGNYLELVLQRGGGGHRDLPNMYEMYDKTGSPARTYSPTPDSLVQSSMSPQLSRMSLNSKPQPFQPSYGGDDHGHYGGASPLVGRSNTFGQDYRQPQQQWSEPAFKAPPTAPTNISVGWSATPSSNFTKPTPGKWASMAPNSPNIGRRPTPGSPSVAHAPPTRGAVGAQAQGGKAVRGRKGDAVFNQAVSSTARIPMCSQCGVPIRGPFVLALGKSWCPDHFKCANCGDKLIDIGFVEENGQLYCEKDYEMYFAPHCNKCQQAIIGDCVHALNQKYHPHCFVCTHCRQPIGSAGFHMEDSNPYCERDWAALYQTKCASCEFPIEPGDLWLEALGNHYHSGCFNCASCQVSLEGQSYFAKGGRAYCSKHAGGRM